MKKFLLGLAATLAPAIMFAEGEGSLDVSEATGAITSIQGAFESILAALGPAVVAVVLAGVAIWAIPRIAGSLKSAFTGGKGR